MSRKNREAKVKSPICSKFDARIMVQGFQNLNQRKKDKGPCKYRAFFYKANCLSFPLVIKASRNILTTLLSRSGSFSINLISEPLGNTAKIIVKSDGRFKLQVFWNGKEGDFNVKKGNNIFNL